MTARVINREIYKHTYQPTYKSCFICFTGGLRYGLKANTTVTFVLQVLVCIMYTIICLMTSQTTQLNVSVNERCVTCLYMKLDTIHNNYIFLDYIDMVSFLLT